MVAKTEQAKRKPLSPRQIEALEAIAARRFYPSMRLEDDGWHARWCAADADSYWVDTYVRSFTMTPLSADAENQRHFTLHDAWLLALRSRTGLIAWDDGECRAFAAELEAWNAPARLSPDASRAISFRFSQAGEVFSVTCAVPRGREALRSLGQAAAIAGELRRLSAAGRRDGRLCAVLSREEADVFVKSSAARLAAAGYGVEGCDIAAQVTLDADARKDESSSAGAPPYKAKLTVRVDGKTVGAAEIKFLLDQKSSLVFFRDRWIEVDRNILKQALRALEKLDGKALDANEAVAVESGIFEAGDIPRSAPPAGGIKSIVDSLRRAGETPIAGFAEPVGFDGVLKDFQKRGAAWMGFLLSHGFGALLADEMGLGKTVQTIAWMLSAKPVRTLVVVPLTLISNWRRELSRFAPGLSVCVHHGRTRQFEGGFAKFASENDVTVTSHSVFVRDFAAMRKVEWDAIVLDEAQAMKNPGTRLAQCLCRMRVAFRIALTGTPVENSAMDVWSIENFLNPGLLGARKIFDKRFCAPISANPGGGESVKLRKMLEPFVLRRLKKDVAAELGPKCEIKEYCPLSPAQRYTYESALEDYRRGERRRGDMFALLVRLKQVCDGDGKFERLEELAKSILDAGESFIVFTQYLKAGEEIRKRLSAATGADVPFLNGAMDAKSREAAIRSFSDSPGPSAFVLSLRAGGYGLNLVKASHVIHFDRWWNPAVEAQATARAHRIGQKNTVVVHSFITEGTLEERIDELLERKSRMAGETILNGESFVKSLSESEFESLVGLDG